MKTDRTVPNAWDIAVFAVIALAAAITLIFSRPGGEPGSSVEIRVGDEIFATAVLSSDKTIDVDGLCVVEISGGEARVIIAKCKNQICVRHRAISRPGEVIICLPQQVTVRVTGGPDAVI